MAKPLITVLVTAHRRRQYIRKALDSVRAQDIDRSEYEVIVVSNFEGSYEGLSNLRWITVDEEGLSPKIAVGFEEARGEVVSMLEDDDRWLPGKLRLVRDLMRRERADFLHNNMVMTYDDAILPPNEQTYLKVCSFSAKIGPGFNTVSLRPFLRRIWPCIWNNSSISIRRDFVLSDQELVRFLKVSNVTHGADWLLTLYSIDYGTVLHVHNPLTLYNLHNFFEAPYHLPERMLARRVRASREYVKVLRFLSNKCKTSRCKLIADMVELAAYPYFLLTNSEGLFDPRPKSEFMRYLGERLPAYLLLLLLYSPRGAVIKTLWSLAPLTLMLRLLPSEFQRRHAVAANVAKRLRDSIKA